MPDLAPCLLERKILPKVWGGRALETVLGIALPEGEAIGESWEVYDRADGSSRIAGSDHTLADLMREHKDELLGRRVRTAYGGFFPLLIKYIDAHDKLSVQVHPDDEQAREENDSGKTEAWVVVHAGPEARIVRGLKSGVTREQFAAVAHTARVEPLLASFAPKTGDAVFVPHGTVHAIGPDVVLFEIQQNSDVTYRLYDWGRPRETHLEKGLRAMRFDLPAQTTVRSEPIPGGGSWLVRHELFRVRKFTVDTPAVLGTEGVCKIMSVLSGQGTLGWRSGGRQAPLLLRQGATVLVPANAGSVFLSPVGGMTILWSDPGETPR